MLLRDFGIEWFQIIVEKLKMLSTKHTICIYDAREQLNYYVNASKNLRDFVQF